MDEDAQDHTTRQDLDLLLFHLKDSDSVITDFEGAKIVRSPSLFDAWVPQPSPCCAAAVIAGVLNALTPNKDWRPSDILPYYISMTDKRIASQKKKLLALMSRHGLAEGALDTLTAAMRAKLHAAHGMSLGDTSKKAKHNKPTKMLLLSVARQCLEEDTLDLPVQVRLALFPGEAAQICESAAIDEATHPQPTEISPARGTGGISFEIPLDAQSKRKSDLPHWKQCQQELYQYWHLLDGREKLVHPTRPSTAICGNAALLFALEAVAEQEPERVFGTRQRLIRGELFVGRTPGSATYRILNADDSDDTRESVWRRLWIAFSCDNTVLVYHMKNHYALIFALREWRSSDGQPHRQLLTARRAQRPSCWVDWAEAYETMAAWHGYKILRISSIVDAEDISV